MTFEEDMAEDLGLCFVIHDTIRNYHWIYKSFDEAYTHYATLLKDYNDGEERFGFFICDL